MAHAASHIEASRVVRSGLRVQTGQSPSSRSLVRQRRAVPIISFGGYAQTSVLGPEGCRSVSVSPRLQLIKVHLSLLASSGTRRGTVEICTRHRGGS